MRKTIENRNHFLSGFLACIGFAAAFFFLGSASRADQLADNLVSQIASEESAARQERDLAERAKSRADEFAKLERAAQNTADRTANPIEKDGWKKSAQGYADDRIRNEAEQKRLEESAARREASVRQLREQLAKAPEPQLPTPPSPAPPQAGDSMAVADIEITLDELIGVWRDQETGRGLAIDRSNKIDPDEANFVTVRTISPGKDRLREWGGRFQKADKSHGARILASYKPEWDEMNREIPEVIRKQIASELEWQLEITTPAACGVTTIDVRWSPGEVTWSADSSGTPPHDGKISGLGDPTSSHFEIDDALDTETASVPVVSVLLSDAPDDAGSSHIGLVPARYLVKGMLFKVEVSLPRDLAKGHGSTLDVSITADSGAATTLRLSRDSAPESFVVTYRQQDWVTIANPGDAAPHDWLFGVLPPWTSGPRLALAARDGDEIRFEIDGSTRSLRLFENPDSAGLYRQREALARLREIYAAALLLPGSSIAQRETAHRMLQLTLNALQLLDATALPAEVKLSSSISYLDQSGTNGLVLAPNLHWLQGALADDGRNPLGIPFIAEEERVALYGGYDPVTGFHLPGSIPGGMEVWRQRTTGVLLRNLAFALYDITVTEAGEDLVIFWGGVDRYGKEMSTGQRVLALLDLGKEFAGGILIPRAMRGAAGTLTGEVANLGELGEALNGTLRQPRLRMTGPIHSERIHIETDAAGASLAPNIRAKLVPAAATPPSSARKLSVSTRYAKAKANVPGPVQSTTSCAPQPRAPTGPFDRAYPANTVGDLPANVEDVLDLDRSANAQRDSYGCQIAVVAEEYEAQKGAHLDQHGAGKYLAEEGAWQPGANKGMSDDTVAKLIHATGGTEFQYAVDLPQVELMRRKGWSIKHKMQNLDGTTHVLSVKKIDLDPKGRATFVTFWDPASARTKRLPACDYRSMLILSRNPDGSIRPHAQFMRWDRRP